MDVTRSGHYLTFRVGRQDLAVDAALVKAVLPAHQMTAAEFPRGPWLLGEATFQRYSFPVLDLRAKLDLRPGTYGRNPGIIALEVDGVMVGFFAERVSEIVHARVHDFSRGKLRIGRPRALLDPAILLDAITECQTELAKHATP